MNLITHTSFGLLLTFLLYSFLGPGLDASAINLILLSAAIGSLIPDIDHPKAYISKSHWMLHGASHLVEVVSHHRGITHSLIAAVLLSLAAFAGLNYFQMDAYLALPFFIGYMGHLLADTCNPSGVKWFQPFSQWSFKLDQKVWFFRIRITTGSIGERMLGIALGAIFLYLYTREFSQGIDIIKELSGLFKSL